MKAFANLRAQASTASASTDGSTTWRLPTVDMGALRSAASDLYDKVDKAVTTARAEIAAPNASSAPQTTTSSTTARRILTPEQRIARFERTLRVSPVPMAQLQALAFVEGVPDGGASSANLRAITWKLLLGYLPPQHANWASHLESQRAMYASFLSELSVDPHAPVEARRVDGAGRPVEPRGGRGGDEPAKAEAEAAEETEAAIDDPLSTAPDSKWLAWHADEELRHEIQKDVDRTLPDYSFFNKEQTVGRMHHDAISRVLFVYAKLNPGIRYVQGMNEARARAPPPAVASLRRAAMRAYARCLPPPGACAHLLRLLPRARVGAQGAGRGGRGGVRRRRGRARPGGGGGGERGGAAG